MMSKPIELVAHKELYPSTNSKYCVHTVHTRTLTSTEHTGMYKIEEQSKKFALSCVKHGECNEHNFKIRTVAIQNYKTFAGSLLNFKIVSPRKFITEKGHVRIAKIRIKLNAGQPFS